MSTNAIRKALEEMRERLQDSLDGPEFSRDQTALDRRRLRDTDEAPKELEAIERAAKDVRISRAPDTSANADAWRVLDAIAKEAP